MTKPVSLSFAHLGAPVVADIPAAAAPTDSVAQKSATPSAEIRITISAESESDLDLLVGKLAAGLQASPLRRSEIQKNSSGRSALSVSFARDDLGLPSIAKKTEPPKPKRRTEEQVEGLKAFVSLGADESMTVRAFAGSGKTTFLRDCAHARPTWRFLYLAFNKPIASEAQRSFPKNVEARTAHALANRIMRQTGREDIGIFTKPETIAEICRIPLRFGVLNQRTVARFVLETISEFCNTADMEITSHHVPSNSKITQGGLTSRIRDYAREAFGAMVAGQLPLDHSVYLKLFQMMLVRKELPKLRYDVVLFDEAQDANPVIASIVDHIQAKTVRVGDSFQQIYAWRGAVDSLDDKRGREVFLTRSFRFGKHIALVANNVLRLHPSKRAQKAPPLVGAGEDEPVTLFGDSDAVLCRSNGGLFEEAIKAAETGKKIAILGEIEELRALVSGAVDLYQGRQPKHGPFSNYVFWEEAVEEVENGLGRDISFVVKRVEQKGIASLQNDLATLMRAHVPEDKASLVLSTIHKAKGREWDSVRLNTDMSTIEEIRAAIDKADGESALRAIAEEVNLIYVAVTRAKRRLILPLGLAMLQYEDFSFVPSMRY